MKTNVLLFSLIILLSNCASPKYIVANESFIEDQNANSIVNYIPISVIDRQNSDILNNACDQIQNKNLKGLENTLNLLDSKATLSPDFFLARALLNISKRHYKHVNEDLKMIPDTSYPLLKKLLTIDMDFELSKRDGVGGFDPFLEKYQALLDQHSENDLLKKILLIRIRYIRYNTEY